MENQNNEMKVGISLDGRVIAESIVKQTTDGFKMSATDITGVRVNDNETK
ncbi:hypothetical protein ACWFN4_00100 [Bacillus mycoides]